jgi:glyoxylase-like metal-dependent hydrolase (beta-lactamase superfamily II)
VTREVDIEQPVQIASGTYWVGRRENTLLERNIYLRSFAKPGRESIHLLIDPGPPADLLALSENVASLIDGLHNINIVFANHQDPDVVYNAAYLQKLNPAMTVVCSEDTWRLIQFYGLDPKRHYAVERFKDLSLKLATGQELRFVPTPFCHFRGATMLYDVETRVLYTGDLFGGLSYVPSFWASERSWEGVKAFHQIYMPTHEALSLAVRSIRALDPAPVLLAPQHGSLIPAPLIPFFLDRLEALPVGLNLLLDSRSKANYLAAMNELLVELGGSLGAEPIAYAMKVFESDGTISNVLTADSSGIREVRIEPGTAIEIFLTQITRVLPVHRRTIDMAATKVLLGRNIPLPEQLQRSRLPSPPFAFEHVRSAGPAVASVME